MNTRRPKSKVLVPVRLLAAIAFATARLHGAVEIYVTQVMHRLRAEAQRHGVPAVFSIADELTNQALPGVRKGEVLARLCWEEFPEMAVTADMNGWLEVTTMAPFLNVATFNNGWDGIDHHNQGRRLINRDFLFELQQKTDAIPWFVNAGSDRFPFGCFFWKMAKYGVRGKVEWYYNLGPVGRGRGCSWDRKRTRPRATPSATTSPTASTSRRTRR